MRQVVMIQSLSLDRGALSLERAEGRSMIWLMVVAKGMRGVMKGKRGLRRQGMQDDGSGSPLGARKAELDDALCVEMSREVRYCYPDQHDCMYRCAMEEADDSHGAV